jgi:hypothetical protein
MTQKPTTSGEIYFDPQPIPTNITKTETYQKEYIAGHSETGHHHLIKTDTIQVLWSGADRFIILKEPAVLFHKKEYERHEDKILQPGCYKINEKQEYDLLQDVMREVHD